MINSFRFTLLIILISFNAINLYAQLSQQDMQNMQLNAIGIVITKDYKPVENAQVFLVDVATQKEVSLQTEVSGNFSFQLFPNRSYQIFAKFGGLTSDKQSFTTNVSTTKLVQSFTCLIPVNHIDVAIINTRVASTNNNSSLTSNSNTKVPSTFAHRSDNSEASAIVSTDQYHPSLNNILLKNINYRVIIGVFSKEVPLNSKYIKLVRDNLVVEENENGEFVYLLGIFDEYNSALSLKKELINKGYEATRIVAYDNELPLPMNAYEVFIASQ